MILFLPKNKIAPKGWCGPFRITIRKAKISVLKNIDFLWLRHYISTEYFWYYENLFCCCRNKVGYAYVSVTAFSMLGGKKTGKNFSPQLFLIRLFATYIFFLLTTVSKYIWCEPSQMSDFSPKRLFATAFGRK